MQGRFSITCYAGYCAVHLLCKWTTMLATSTLYDAVRIFASLLTTPTLYDAVRIPADRFCVIETKFPTYTKTEVMPCMTSPPFLFFRLLQCFLQLLINFIILRVVCLQTRSVQCLWHTVGSVFFIFRNHMEDQSVTVILAVKIIDRIR